LTGLESSRAGHGLLADRDWGYCSVTTTVARHFAAVAEQLTTTVGTPGIDYKSHYFRRRCDCRLVSLDDDRDGQLIHNGTFPSYRQN
jgi:hypothetical protein